MTRRTAFLFLVVAGSLFLASSNARAEYAMSRILNGYDFVPGRTFLPDAIAVDNAGNVFVAGRERVQEPFEETGLVIGISVDGEITELLDATGDGQGNPLGRPRAIAVDDDGNVYVGASISRNVFKITPSGATSVILDETGDGNGYALKSPRAIDIGPDGAVYVCQSSSGTDAFKIARNGQISKVKGNYRCTNLVIDNDSSVFTTSDSFDNVRRTDPSGNRTEVISRDDGLDAPFGLDVDSEGNVFVAGLISDNVLMRSPDGAITEVIGPDDGLIRPMDIALSNDGTLYVTGSQVIGGSMGTVFEVTPNGEVTRLIDFRVPGTNIYLNNPDDVVVDRRDVVYIAGSSLVLKLAPDSDGDGVCDVDDNCPDISNADQTDMDNNGVGDACDEDMDGDGILNFTDNCPLLAGNNLNDADGDGIGDLCDTCTDSDEDGFGDPEFAQNTCPADNCPDDFNEFQDDVDQDGFGDACDTCSDSDGDGFGDPGFAASTCELDNCPFSANPDQADLDEDGVGDDCSDDVDDDGILNVVDNCPRVPSIDLSDSDGDGIGDLCDTCTDSDGDGFGDPGFEANTCDIDNCPDTPNADQVDRDNDGIGDVCGGSAETPASQPDNRNDQPSNGMTGAGEDEDIFDSDRDGVANEFDRCESTSAYSDVDDEGCALVNDVSEGETDDTESRTVGTEGSIGCGAMGMVTIPLMMLGFGGLKSNKRYGHPQWFQVWAPL